LGVAKHISFQALGPDILSPGLDQEGQIFSLELLWFFVQLLPVLRGPAEIYGAKKTTRQKAIFMGIMRRIREWLGYLIFTASTWYAMPQALLGLSGTYIIFGDNVTVLCGFPLQPAGPAVCLTRF
jgi:hypothetical protein